MTKEILDDCIKQLTYYSQHPQFLQDASAFFKECEEKFKDHEDSDDITLRNSFRVSFLTDMIWGIYRPIETQAQVVIWIDEFISESEWKNAVHRIRDL